MKTDLSIKAAIYLHAAELVEQGHCKNTFWRDKNGLSSTREDAKSFCYYGAIIAATYEMSGVDHLQDFPMANWNDDPDTTAAMVAAKLREQAFA